MQNYFNYFTEIEEHFQRRRGSLLLLSTVDWVLIETWRDAGIPVEVALRGIDDAFDKYEARKSKRAVRRINGLGWCAQAVAEAAEQQLQASVGIAPAHNNTSSEIESQLVANHLRTAAASLRNAAITPLACAEIASRLETLAELALTATCDHETLEAHLAVLEEKLFAALSPAAPEQLIVDFKTQAARELAAYRSRMNVTQLRQIELQFTRKRLLEHYGLMRLSLFYMRQS